MASATERRFPRVSAKAVEATCDWVTAASSSTTYYVRVGRYGYPSMISENLVIGISRKLKSICVHEMEPRSSP